MLRDQVYKHDETNARQISSAQIVAKNVRHITVKNRHVASRYVSVHIHPALFPGTYHQVMYGIIYFRFKKTWPNTFEELRVEIFNEIN